MRIAVSSVLLCVLLTISAFAEDGTDGGKAFQEIAGRLAAPAVLRGNFTQARTIALISRPLESSGSFILSDMGLYWQQDKPLRSIMIADGERLVQQFEDGPLQGIDTAQNPMVLTFSSSFLNIFRGSEAELRSNFEIAVKREGDLWTIGLAPTTYPMSEAIDSIILRGRAYIEELTVINRSSDKTMIRFSDLRTEPDQLTENEIELYAR